jgi:hypothetical protein
MAKNKPSGEINKSAEIRELIKQNPQIKVKEAIAILGKRGIKINQGLFYSIKGRMQGQKSRRNKARQMVEKVTATGITSSSDVVSTIIKVKHLAAEVGGLKKLKALVDALAE